MLYHASFIFKLDYDTLVTKKLLGRPYTYGNKIFCDLEYMF